MKIGRRTFLRLVAQFSAAGVLVGFIPSYVRSLKSPVRPPGAVEEDLFLARCLRCGRCLEVCPTGAITLSGVEDGLMAVGTPTVDALRGPCEAFAGRCDGLLPCVRSCPSGALQWGRGIKIGSAEIDRSLCIAWKRNGGCLVCKEVCPVPEAIQVGEKKPHFNPDACIGCGRCVYACPAEPKALKVTSMGVLRTR